MKNLRLTILGTTALLAAGCMTVAFADPPPWAPAHGWRAKHHYVYYPSAQVYYAPETRMWFWLGGDGWQVGASLPLALQGFVRTGGIRIGLDVDRPYLRNSYVVSRYGGHRREYWRHDADYRHGDDDRDWREDRDRYEDRDWDRDRDRHGNRNHGRHEHGHGRGHGRGNHGH